MSGLLRRLTRRRPATADENPSPEAGSAEPTGASAEAPADPGGDRPVPAGADPAVGGDRPGSAGADPAVSADQAASGDPATSADPAATGDAATPGDRLASGDPASAEQPTQVLPATGEQTAVGQGPESSPGAEWATSPGTGRIETDQPTVFAVQPTPSRDLPAGVDAGDLTTATPASARRGKLRRRLRYLRHVRELLLRDLGGFTYEIHRTAGGTHEEGHRRLSAAKANRIAALDAEVGAIEAHLGEPHPDPVLREAGIGGTCPECGELHASDARFCSRCGAPLDARARAEREAAAVVAAKAAPVPESAPDAPPASVLWAGGPAPSTDGPDASAAEDRPAAVTSEWLATGDRPTTFERPSQAAEEPAAANAGETTSAAGAATAANEPTTAAGDEPAAVRDEPVATPSDEPVSAATDERVSAGGGEAAASGEPAPTRGDEAAAGDEPPVIGDEGGAAAGEGRAPASGDETPASEEPLAMGDEGAAAAGDERAPASDDEAPASGDEAPASDEPPAMGDEGAATAGDERAPASGDEASASGDEAPASGEPATAGGDESSAAADEPAPGPAKPKRARAKKPPAAPAGGEADRPEASNGRRSDDVPRPLTSGDPLTTRRERGS